MTILWDWNGTLVEDVAYTVGINNGIFPALGYAPITIEGYRKDFRFPIKAYYDTLGISDEDFRYIAKTWNAIYVERFNEVPLGPHRLEVVRRFHDLGVRQVIISASQHDQLQEQVAHFPELQGMFDQVLGIHDVYAASKVQLAKDFIAHDGVDPKDVMFLGDTTHDAEVAAAIGVRCCLISGGHQNDEVLATAGVPVLKDVREVFAILGLGDQES